jgi:hypothetical protein
MRSVLLLVALAWGCGTTPAGTGEERDGGPDEVGVESAPQEDVRLADHGDAAEVPDAGAEEKTEVVDAAEAAGEVEVMGPQPGEAGAECAVQSDCLSGFCIYTPDGYRCTELCEEECPFGWQCAAWHAGGPDEVYICVPAEVVLCRPCQANVECLAAGADVGAVCLAYGPQGSFCATTCETPSDCPSGYACKAGVSASGEEVWGCRTKAVECPCTKLAADEAAATGCRVENEWGTCEGMRECTAGGLTPCSA